MASIDGVNDCIPESTLMEQYDRCAGELCELKEALINHIADEQSGKVRAEVAFEAMDVVAAITTLVNMMFDSEEIAAAVAYTNAKNQVRGYRRRIF